MVTSRVEKPHKTGDGERLIQAARSFLDALQAEDGVGIHGPRLLPDGDTVIFSEGVGVEWLGGARVVAHSLSTGERTVLVNGGSDARYLPTGHLVYARGDGLFAVAFDAETLTVQGGAVPLVQGVMRSVVEMGTANYSVSADGTLAYIPGGISGSLNPIIL